MGERWYITGLLVLIVFALAAGLVGGVVLDRQLLLGVAPAGDVPEDAVDEFALIAEAWRVINREYVDREQLEARELGYGAIDGLVRSLGDTGHSRFLSPDMVEQQRNFIEGRFEGIGAYVEMKDERVVIAAPIEGSPAERAGLQAGDVILAVDGEDTSGMSLDEVVARTKGPAGTRVGLTILDPDTGEVREVEIERASIDIENVTWAESPGTGVAHLRIAAFSEGVAEDLEAALDQIQARGMDGVVLDLRNSPGGLLDEAVATASQFVADGNVLLERDAEGEINPVPVEPGGAALDIPMVLLINRGTASGAEVVTGALQDAGRAIAIGETTFGAGTVLSQFRLSDGSVLLLAIREWLTPAGRVIWHQGLDPEIEVILPPGVAPVFPRGEQDLDVDGLLTSGDDQLLRALEVLDALPSR
jgi:carboxyl-terminal processing protease